MNIWGPEGTRTLVQRMLETYRFDIDARVKNGRKPPAVDVHEIAEGTVFQQGGLVVRAFQVDHGDISPAFGYRVDFGGRAVVLSGDTRYSESLIRMARGVDLLIHEVALGAPGIPPQQQYAMAQHTLPDQAARVFERVKPRLAVYSHIGVAGGATEAQVMDITRGLYSGRVEMAMDLSVVEVGDEVTFVPSK